MTTSPTTSTSPWPTATSKTYPQFLLFGDSITQACNNTILARLSDQYSRRLDIINRGFSGYNAPSALSPLSQFFPSAPPSQHVPHIRLMTVFFGANDATVPGDPQHVPVEKYCHCLRQIALYEGVRMHKTKLIFVVPAPVDEWQLDTPTRTAANAALYARACRETAASLSIPVVDLWTIFMHKAGWDPKDEDAPLVGSKGAPRSEVLGELLFDGLHFTDDGYALMFDELVKVIEESYPEETPERLPMVFPDWMQVMGLTPMSD